MINRLLHPWRCGRLWRSLIHSVLDLPVGVVIGMPTVILSVVTVVSAVAFPMSLIAAAALLGWTRLAGHVERHRIRSVLGLELTDPIEPLPAGSLWIRARSFATSRPRWKGVGYCLLRLPVSWLIFATVVGSWGVSAVLLALPALVSFLPQDTAQFGWFGASFAATLPLSVLGLSGLVAGAPWLTLGAARVDGALMRWLLAPPAGSELEARAARAETGRAAAVDAAEAERRRIERDLHDGAQQRLVALAVDLGSARERFDTDPEGARALVAEAHEEAKAALREIRDLARGIHPAILEDRGLDAALSAVVARSPVPVALTVDISDRHAGRLPDPIESAAYFVVSEALTNVARHAQATQAHVAIVTSGDNLIVEVRDDGIGGADGARGTGITGLRDRVVALGGTIDLLSPPGGPTTVLVEIPCAS